MKRGVNTDPDYQGAGRAFVCLSWQSLFSDYCSIWFYIINCFFTPPGAHANAPPGGACGDCSRQSIGRLPRPFTRRTTSAVSAANECEGITCLRQVTKNDSDEAERSERSPPPGVARNAGGEGVDGRSPASKRRSRARERKCLATGPASATGEGVRGTCATSPGAIRRPEARCSLPSGHHACSCV